MKTVTIDYDTYHRELREAREKGIVSGMTYAAYYIEDQNTPLLTKREYYTESERLDAAIKMRNDKACEAYVKED